MFVSIASPLGLLCSNLSLLFNTQMAFFIGAVKESNFIPRRKSPLIISKELPSLVHHLKELIKFLARIREAFSMLQVMFYHNSQFFAL